MRELLMRAEDHVSQSSGSNVVRRRNEEEEEGGERDRVFGLYRNLSFRQSRVVVTLLSL